MTSWKSKISQCFGHQDGKFSSNDLAEQCAGNMLRQSVAEGASMEDVLQELEAYMRTQAFNSDLIADNLMRAANPQTYV